MHSDQRWYSAAFGVGAAHQVTRALRCHHDDVDALRWVNALVTNVETVCECKSLAIYKVWLNAFFVDLLLLGVWSKDHDQVGILRSIGNAHHLEASGLGFCLRRRTVTQANNHINARLFQVERMCMAL